MGVNDKKTTTEQSVWNTTVKVIAMSALWEKVARNTTVQPMRAVYVCTTGVSSYLKLCGSCKMIEEALQKL